MSEYFIQKLNFNENDGKEIAEFLADNFHKEHSFTVNGKSPRLHWGRVSHKINSVLLDGVVFVVRNKDEDIIGSVGLEETNHWWSDENFLGDSWFYVLPEYKEITDGEKPSELLLKTAMNYAKDLNKPIVMGVYNISSVEKAEKLFFKNGFHKIGGTYYNDLR